MRWLRWFIAGALAVPVHHQLVLLALNTAGLISRQPWSMQPTRPFDVPSIVSLSFWGGVWGVILGFLIAGRTPTLRWWLSALVFGAVFPTLVAIFIVPPLKGMPINTEPKMFIGGALLNGAWGIGTASFALLFNRLLRRPV